MASAEQIRLLEALKERLRTLDGLAVAYSGGVDSTLLLAVAAQVLGDRVIAITNKSPLVPDREHAESVAFCDLIGVRQIVIEACDLQSEAFIKNPLNRCYLCKKALLKDAIRIAKENGYDTVAEGSNVDDCCDYRPGFEAVKELGVISPLLEAGMTKQDIRDLSRDMNLPTWNKQSFACLASRFPYGDAITEEQLKRVAAAEQHLLDLGLSCARVRVHGDLARIEVCDSDFELVLSKREVLSQQFSRLGFTYTALDLIGYRTGSMNESLSNA